MPSDEVRAPSVLKHSRKTPRAPKKRRSDLRSAAWDVATLLVCLALGAATAAAIWRGRVTEAVSVALWVTFWGFRTLRR
jgi:hypothetical protein